MAALAPEHEDPNVGWYNRFARHPYYGPLGMLFHKYIDATCMYECESLLILFCYSAFIFHHQISPL